MAGYFNLEMNPAMARTLTHSLNTHYKGARRFELRAPDAAGTLIVHARDEKEAEDHLKNALFDLIFNRNRVGASVENPACLFCGYRTESRGRNSSGTRGWRCLNPECRRSFVINRTFRGGINHPCQSKKPQFRQLVFVEGKTLVEAQDILGISHGAAHNWFEKMAAVNRGFDMAYPCGKPLVHRGSCKFRQLYAQMRSHETTRAMAGELARKAVAGKAAA